MIPPSPTVTVGGGGCSGAGLKEEEGGALGGTLNGEGEEGHNRNTPIVLQDAEGGSTQACYNYTA